MTRTDLSHLEIRAVVLAAGHGKRLRPLTEFLPKPLLPVHGREIVARSLASIAELGCRSAAVNLHYQGERIREALGGAFEGLKLTYSEEETLLGTLGALTHLRDFLAPADLVLVINGDSLCRWPLRELVERHLKSGAVATLLMSKRAPVERFGGGVAVDAEGRVLSFRPDGEVAEGARRRVFAGAHVFSPRLLEGLPVAPSDTVSDLYSPLLERGAFIDALDTSRRWYDLGTPRRALEGILDWTDGNWSARLSRQPWRSPSAVVSAEARVRNTVIERAVSVDAEAEVEGSVLLPGARVGRGCRVRRSILGFDTVLRPGTDVDGRMVTPLLPSVPPRDEDSVVGGLVYTAIV